ncbi:MAG: adenylyltransferase/cytidyltransferase family protein [Kofleriaceae bacterium]|nr:adenylyltransferase/cytidyltransferase family protein [Kofleriaceae bacterium]
MSSPRRTLVVWDGQSLRQELLEALLQADRRGDEVIVALIKAEEGFSCTQPATGGRRIERLSGFLRSRLRSPLYLLPTKSGQLSMAQLALRLRYDAPVFAHLVTSEQTLARAAASLLGCTTQIVESDTGPDLLVDAPSPSLRRGLFVTRAQPFHLGHAACVQKIAEEMDEIIVLVALSETSHSLQNPATAGERLEMIHPYLQRIVPGRFHLAAAPYQLHTACNISELQLLLPSFERVYSNSRSVQVLAVSAGLRCSSVQSNVGVSGTQVRLALQCGDDLEGLLPPEVEAVLGRLGMRERLQRLASEEVREEN